jgi:hypothetical protein
VLPPSVSTVAVACKLNLPSWFSILQPTSGARTITTSNSSGEHDVQVSVSPHRRSRVVQMTDVQNADQLFADGVWDAQGLRINGAQYQERALGDGHNSPTTVSDLSAKFRRHADGYDSEQRRSGCQQQRRISTTAIPCNAVVVSANPSSHIDAITCLTAMYRIRFALDNRNCRHKHWARHLTLHFEPSPLPIRARWCSRTFLHRRSLFHVERAHLSHVLSKSHSSNPLQRNHQRWLQSRPTQMSRWILRKNRSPNGTASWPRRCQWMEQRCRHLRRTRFRPLLQVPMPHHRRAHAMQ